MDYEKLWTISARARDGEKLTPGEARFVRDVIPRELSTFPDVAVPPRIRHPAGFSVAGAPVGTFVRSALLLSARRVLGPRYGGTAVFYDRVEMDLAFRIMRSHFHLGYPKGTHCCAQCTLAVYPVLAAGTIRWFDCSVLAPQVRTVITAKQWRFAKAANARMVAWSLLDR